MATALALMSMPAVTAAADGHPSQRPVTGMVITESNLSFADTWDTLTEALDANPNIGVLGVIDHAANAATVGLTLEPNRVVFFGNPNLGTPLMQINQTVGIDLPQKLLVWQDGTKVFVGYNGVRYLAARHRLGQAPTLATIAAALRGLSGTATDNEVDDQRIPRTKFVARHPGLVTLQSSDGVDETFARLVAAIDASPANVAFTVDHAANAASAGLDLRPTKLVVFGNPNLGTPLMEASASTGIDLPLKMLVWEDENGATQITYTNIRFLVLRHRIDGQRDLAASIGTALANFAKAASG